MVRVSDTGASHILKSIVGARHEISGLTERMIKHNQYRYIHKTKMEGTNQFITTVVKGADSL